MVVAAEPVVVAEVGWAEVALVVVEAEVWGVVVEEEWAWGKLEYWFVVVNINLKTNTRKPSI